MIEKGCGPEMGPAMLQKMVQGAGGMMPQMMER